MVVRPPLVVDALAVFTLRAERFFLAAGSLSSRVDAAVFFFVERVRRWRRAPEGVVQEEPQVVYRLVQTGAFVSLWRGGRWASIKV